MSSLLPLSSTAHNILKDDFFTKLAKLEEDCKTGKSLETYFQALGTASELLREITDECARRSRAHSEGPLDTHSQEALQAGQMHARASQIVNSAGWVMRHLKIDWEEYSTSTVGPVYSSLRECLEDSELRLHEEWIETKNKLESLAGLLYQPRENIGNN